MPRNPQFQCEAKGARTTLSSEDHTMHIDLTALDAARTRRRESRGLAEALMIKLQIQDGYELAALLGFAPHLSNRQAVRQWVTGWLDAPSQSQPDFVTACRDLSVCIEEGCQ